MCLQHPLSFGKVILKSKIYLKYFLKIDNCQMNTI